MTVASYILDEGHERKASAAALDQASVNLLEKVLSEQLLVEVKAVVETAIQENVQSYLELRKKNEVRNPLMRIIYGL